jgi:phospholipid/cholesterol/gamma-HCH transport system substrate-binding protein
MSRHLSVVGAVAVAATIVFAVAVFLVFNASFGGPSIVGKAPRYRLIADVQDAQNVIGKSLVLNRGIQVGEGEGVKLAGGQVRLTLAVDPARTAVYRDATVQVAHRTLFGEAYVRLDPGRPGAGRLASGSVLPARAVIPAVGLDQALAALDRPTRRHVSSLARTGAGVEAGHRSTERLNRSLAELPRVLVALRQLSGQLSGQEANTRGFVSNTTSLIGRLASREAAIRSLVANGRTTLGAMTADAGNLTEGVDEAGRLLDTARMTLSDLRPLIGRATPVVDGLTDTAPSLRRALARVPASSRALRSTLAALPQFRAAAVPALRSARALGRPAQQALATLEPALRDLVPALRYIGPYGPDVIGFFGVGAGALRRLDASGMTVGPDIPFVKTLKDWRHNCVDPDPCAYGRFNIGPAAGSLVGEQLGLGANPYPPPGDSTSAWSGRYPQLRPEPLPR